MYLDTFEVEKVPMFGQDKFDYFWFYSDGSRFEYAEYVKLKLGCNFDFKQFPFDSHQCNLKFLSPSYDAYNLNFSIPWLVQDEKESQNETFELATQRIPFGAEMKSIQKIGTKYIMGYEYNVAGIHFDLTRTEIELLVSGYFFPSGLFAFFSILALFIKVGNVSDRVTMLLTICLISMTLYVTVQAPPQRGMSYIEIWTIGMLIPIILAILESSLVLFKMRSKSRDEGMNVSEDGDDPGLRMYDFITAILLAGYFVLFQFIYWSIALSK